MPAIGSIQHVALQMEAEKELGNPKALNTQIVAMAHPDATAAILSKREITCHLTSPPFQYEQIRDPGIRKVMDSYQAGGRGVVGLGRGRSGGVWGRRQPKVGEDRAHDTGVLHSGDETQATATARAGQHVERARPVHQRRPGPGAWGALAPGVARAGVALAGVRISGHRATVAGRTPPRAPSWTRASARSAAGPTR